MINFECEFCKLVKQLKYKRRVKILKRIELAAPNRKRYDNVTILNHSAKLGYHIAYCPLCGKKIKTLFEEDTPKEERENGTI